MIVDFDFSNIGGRKPPRFTRESTQDIVTFQEVWHFELREYLIWEMKNRGYLYSADNTGVGVQTVPPARGILGNGLLIVSRYPLIGGTDRFDFSTFTRPEEYFARKGAIHTVVRLPDFEDVDVYAAHLGAAQFDDGQRDFNSQEENGIYVQSKELGSFIESTHHSSAVVLGVDMNSHVFKYSNVEQRYTQEPSRPWEFLVNGLGLLDTMNSLLGPEAGTQPTYTKLNPYVANGIFKNQPSECGDYVFFSQEKRSPRLVLKKSQIVFDQPVGPDKVYLSDHFGVLSSFRVVAN